MIEKIALSQVPPIGGIGRGQPGSATASGQQFADLVREFANKSINAEHEGEKLSVQAVDNDADLVDIVTAVTNAEITLETVVTLRDRVIQAYQEVIRMPI